MTSLQELETAINLNGEIVVSKNNVILMSMEEYKKKLLKKNRKKLLKAEEQIKNGKAVKADEVFKELEEIYEF